MLEPREGTEQREPRAETRGRPRGTENASNVSQQVRRAAALTAELAAQSEKKTAAVCDQPPGLDELAGHIEAPNMGADGSHPQATMMPDPWATYERPSSNEGQSTTSAPPETNEDTFALTKGFRKGRSRSAIRNVETRSMVDEVLDYYVKATGRDGTQKREELVNMSQANCDEVGSVGKHAQKKCNTFKTRRSKRGISAAECRTSVLRTRRTSRKTSNKGQCTMARLLRGSCRNG